MFGVYVHWPFCASKCPYCDFNSHVSEHIDHDDWAQAFEKEISYYASLTPGRVVSSVFFGGGTPSLMKPSTVEAVVEKISQCWTMAEDIEITLEANPTSVEADKFIDFQKAGINRVSIGVQALNNTDLQFLGRQHDVSQALEAIETASKTFSSYSFDLIYARPGQDAQAWRNELEKALSYADGHLSLYQLTIEQGTPFYMRHKRGDFSIPDEDVAGDLYEVTQSVLDGAGMPAYEISNHAVPEKESKHNLTYWRYTDYVGVGPGAHGRLTLHGEKQATRGHRAPDVWMNRVREYDHGAHPFETLSAVDRFHECVMMGLRLREGIPWERLCNESGKEKASLFDQAKLTSLEAEGLLHIDDTELSLSTAGRQRLNAVLQYLL